MSSAAADGVPRRRRRKNAMRSTACRGRLAVRPKDSLATPDSHYGTSVPPGHIPRLTRRVSGA